MNYKRNIPLLYVYSILIKRVSMPIIILYFLLHHLNYTQIGILAATIYITTLLTEVHGGTFADSYGKKTSLILGAIFGFLTMFFYFIGNSFEYFLVASLMYGFSGSFTSGTREALLYDSLVQEKKPSRYKKYWGRVIFFSHIFNAVVLLIVPVLYEFNTKLPFILGMLFFALATLLALFFREPRRSKKLSSNLRIVHSIKESTSNNRLLIGILLTAVAGAFVWMSMEFIQPLLKIAKLPVIYFGVIYALKRVLMGLSGASAYKLEKTLPLTILIYSGLGLIALGFLGYWLGAGLIIILSVLLIDFAQGLNRVILSDEVNKHIKSKNRTTVLSLTSMFTSLCQASAVFIFGIVADFVGVQSMYGYVLLTFLICLAIIGVFMSRTSYWQKHTH